MHIKNIALLSEDLNTKKMKTYSVLYWQNIIGIRMSDHITVTAKDQYEAVSKAEQQLTSEGTPFESIGCAYEKTK